MDLKGKTTTALPCSRVTHRLVRVQLCLERLRREGSKLLRHDTIHPPRRPPSLHAHENTVEVTCPITVHCAGTTVQLPDLEADDGGLDCRALSLRTRLQQVVRSLARAQQHTRDLRRWPTPQTQKTMRTPSRHSAITDGVCDNMGLNPTRTCLRHPSQSATTQRVRLPCASAALSPMTGLNAEPSAMSDRGDIACARSTTEGASITQRPP